MTSPDMDDEAMKMADVETAINISHTFVEEAHRPAAIRRIAEALAAVRLAAVIETQRLDAELVESFGSFGGRDPAAAIRSGQQFRKDV